MFKKVLVDLYAKIDMPVHHYRYFNLETMAKILEDDAKELTAFLKDHRSRDSYTINIERIYESKCEFCDSIEERDTDGTPVCCQKAQDEFIADKKRIDIR